jgi:hypothetical protein
MKYELTVVKGNNAYCPKCYDEINHEPCSFKKHEKAEKKSALPKGTKVLKISVATDGGGRTSFLCMRHANQLRDALNNMNLEEE